MLEFLPADVAETLRIAQTAKLTRRSRLRVRVGAREFPIVKLWDEGLIIDASHTTHLHGLVDVFDGSRHILECLIIASSVEHGQLICGFKRSTMVTENPALDYFRDPDKPIALLTKA
ncbi:MAG: hypothetical protein RIR95_1568 [Pseudomonadota bacterium]|jgi:hypothetical protein